MRLRSPWRTRGLASQTGRETWNLLAIQRSSAPDYLLGQDMIQEVQDDFTRLYHVYLEEQALDPIDLLQALDNIHEGCDSYWLLGHG